ncbi:MAG: ATP-dependent DNA helicase RecG [Myxococcota bacterium]
MSSSLRTHLSRFIQVPNSENWGVILDFSKNIKKCSSKGKSWLNKLNLENSLSKKKYLAGMGLRLLDNGDLKEKKTQKRRSSKTQKKINNRDNFLNTNVEEISGCGPACRQKLEEVNIHTLSDLLGILPSSYIDLRKITSVSELQEGKTALIKAEINSIYPNRNRAFITASDQTGKVKLNWFRIWPGFLGQLKKGNTYFFWGKPGYNRGVFNFSHPAFSTEQPEGFFVQYPKTGKISQNKLTKLIKNALKLVFENLDKIQDPLPARIIEKYDFPSWYESRKIIHQPNSDISISQLEKLAAGDHRAFNRMVYEELFYLQLSLGLKRKSNQKGISCRINPEHQKQILPVFPFDLTPGQKKATAEITRDLAKGSPMCRLLQGDVGSGKTATAFLAAAQVMMTGRQVAFMAPTTILANQHLHNLKIWCEKLGYKIELLSTEVSPSRRETILALLESGYINLLVGTHSLIQERVRFNDLGLVIVDEQHRFGVEQRARLATKNKYEIPHLLVMTATPIPRSLALTAFGDLEQSIIPDLPPGRMEVNTTICKTRKQKIKTIEKIDKKLAEGEKAFVVSPLIDKGDELNRIDIKKITTYLKQNLNNGKLGILHGKLSFREKNNIVEKFRKGEINIVISTTVIEVGMDIPDAGIMVILEADRFGMAQLHQLRGRVGRSFNKKAWCYLFQADNPTPEGKKRLKIIENNSNGFKLAEEDLKMRGPGEIIGTRQSGAYGLKYEKLLNQNKFLDFLINARKDAKYILQKDTELSHNYYLKQEVEKFNPEKLFGEESG